MAQSNGWPANLGACLKRGAGTADTRCAPPGAMQPAPTNPAAASLRLVPETPSTHEPGVVESYRRLADVFHDVLSEQSLDALLERIADTVGELIPYDDLHIYEANETTRTLKAVFVRGEWAEEVLADRPITFGEGITGWAVDIASRCSRTRRTSIHASASSPTRRSARVARLSPADRARPAEREPQHLPRGRARGLHRGEFQLAARFGDAAALALDNAHIRASLELQAQTDGLTGSAQPPGLP